MGLWNIHKDIEFCYGHRTYTQRLNGKFSKDLKQSCRHYHGHEGKVTVYLTAGKLEDTGMVTDFRHLEWLKKFIDEYIDHQFIMDYNDPLFNMFVKIPYETMIGCQLTDEEFRNAMRPVVIPDTDYVIGWKMDCSQLTDEQKQTPYYEAVEGFTIVDFVPTSEHLSRWMANMVQARMKELGVTVSQLDWWETPKSCSTYNP